MTPVRGTSRKAPNVGAAGAAVTASVICGFTVGLEGSGLPEAGTCAERTSSAAWNDLQLRSARCVCVLACARVRLAGSAWPGARRLAPAARDRARARAARVLVQRPAGRADVR